MRLIFLLILIQNVFTWRMFPIKKKYQIKKQFISISPGGVYGFYTLGLSSYLQQNYDTDKYHFIGASSGSWNSLVCCFKHNQTDLINELLNQDFLVEPDSLSMLQEKLRNYILSNYNSEDFNLNKLHISISELDNLELKNVIINNFTKLEDALECCILSCHIPFLTSEKIIKKHNDKIIFDGGLTEFPPKNISNFLLISPNRYNKKNLDKAFNCLITRKISKEIIHDLYNKGYQDAIKHKKEFDSLFSRRDFLFYLDYL